MKSLNYIVCPSPNVFIHFDAEKYFSIPIFNAVEKTEMFV